MPFTNTNQVSIIIPTRNESIQLPGLLSYLKALPGWENITEIIISDGKSTDATVDIARDFGAKIINNERSGRGIQVNEGARQASGNILYFLHADSFPPPNFVKQVLEKINDGYVAGCYRLRSDYRHWFLQANAWFTRFNINAFRFGDQSLFISKQLFNNIGGFSEDLIIMEDQEIIHRICKKGKFTVIPDYVTTSARKYSANGVYRMQAIFFYIYFSYVFGASQRWLVKEYKRLIR